MWSKVAVVTLALVAILIGAECVAAAVKHQHDDEVVAPASLVAAELDPAFMHKLTERMRGFYERSRQASAQPSF
jgi:hypothetical protein